jgi:hypothetical protein
LKVVEIDVFSLVLSFPLATMLDMLAGSSTPRPSRYVITPPSLVLSKMPVKRDRIERRRRHTGSLPSA